jgi:GalNAc-alpha-(1->4)-GalNAc-alpha-(1->3)-diNAcBac-PP-undecaprenol alpha-1,4-N-acetyl-D-galactosaminyltransferase
MIHALGGGGAERVMSIMANYWATKGWDVTLICLAESTRPISYPIDPSVDLRQIGVIGDSPSALDLLFTGSQRIWSVRRAILDSQPDVVIAFMNTVNVITLCACLGTKIPVIVSDHIYPGFEDANQLWQLLMKISYKWADRVTVLTQSALSFYPATSGYRAVVMPNPILTPVVTADAPPFLPANSLVAVGRLHPQKGFDLLIQAFAQVHQLHPAWQLTILGEGEERAALEAMRDRLGLQDCVHLPGRVTNVNDYLAQADLYVMSSRFEGFPMALCEAMAVGTPVLSVDCLSGPREIITDGIDGMLVPANDIDALANGIDRAISAPQMRVELGKNAPQILARFGVDRVMDLWFDLIRSIRRSNPS